VPDVRSNHFSKDRRPQSEKSIRFVSIVRFDNWAERIESRWVNRRQPPQQCRLLPILAGCFPTIAVSWPHLSADAGAKRVREGRDWPGFWYEYRWWDVITVDPCSSIHVGRDVGGWVLA
jgi:hypothetical protein